MKKILLFFTILTAALCSQPAQAKPRIPVTYGDHEKIEKVAELPDEFTTDNGVKLALGHKYTVFELAFVPIWTTNKGKLVGFDPNDDQNGILCNSLMSFTPAASRIAARPSPVLIYASMS